MLCINYDQSIIKRFPIYLTKFGQLNLHYHWGGANDRLILYGQNNDVEFNLTL